MITETRAFSSSRGLWSDDLKDLTTRGVLALPEPFLCPCPTDTLTIFAIFS
jgi:hypothetical protein